METLVVDADVLAEAVNEWPYGDAARILRECIRGQRLQLVMSERLTDALHDRWDNGLIQVQDEELFRRFLGLIESFVWHEDSSAETALAMPEYYNALAIASLAAAIVTRAGEVARAATAAAPIEPGQAVARWAL